MFLQWLFLMQALAHTNTVERLQECDAAAEAASVGSNSKQRRQKRRARQHPQGVPQYATAAFVNRLAQILYGLPVASIGHAMLPCHAAQPENTPLDLTQWQNVWPQVHDAAVALTRSVQCTLQQQHSSPQDERQAVLAQCNGAPA